MPTEPLPKIATRCSTVCTPVVQRPRPPLLAICESVICTGPPFVCRTYTPLPLPRIRLLLTTRLALSSPRPPLFAWIRHRSSVTVCTPAAITLIAEAATLLVIAQLVRRRLPR
jgi:hypothetical protein